MRIRTAKGLFVVITCFCLMLFALAGCGGQSATSSSESSASSESLEASDQAVNPDVVIGTDADGAKSIVVTNTTGKTITNVAITESGADVEPVFLMDEGDEWKDGQVAELFYKPVGSDVYDVQLQCGEETYTLHSFSFAGAENVVVAFGSDVAYVTFDRDGNLVSSLEDEVARKAAADAAAAEATAAEEAAFAEEYYESEPVYYEEPQPTYNAPSQAPAQSGDQCVDGGVVLR